MPDASQFTQIKRLQTSAAADKGAGPNKFRAPRFFDGWNPGQLINFGKNALLSNKFIIPPIIIYKWIVSTFYNNSSYNSIGCIAVDSQGNIYLGFAARTLKLSPSGTLLVDVSISSNALAIREPFLYIAGTSEVRRYNLSDLTENNTGFTPFSVNSIRTLAINSAGTHLFYVTPLSPFALVRRAIDGSGAQTQLTAGDINNANNITIRTIGGIEYAFVSESGTHQISRYNLSVAPNIPRVIVAGISGNQGYSGDGVSATAAQLRAPRGIAFDSQRNMYVFDTGNNVIRRVDAVTNIITTFAGIQTVSPTASTGNGEEAINARFHTPVAGLFSSSGVLYVLENGSTTRDVAAITNTEFYE